MAGQIVDASLIAAPLQRNTQGEKAIKDGRIPDDWKNQPAKLRQKDRDARWTVKYTKAKPREEGSTPLVDLAIPVFGYQNHVSIDRGFGFNPGELNSSRSPSSSTVQNSQNFPTVSGWQAKLLNTAGPDFRAHIGRRRPV